MAGQSQALDVSELALSLAKQVVNSAQPWILILSIYIYIYMRYPVISDPSWWGHIWLPKTLFFFQPSDKADGLTEYY